MVFGYKKKIFIYKIEEHFFGILHCWSYTLTQNYYLQVYYRKYNKVNMMLYQWIKYMYCKYFLNELSIIH